MFLESVVCKLITFDPLQNFFFAYKYFYEIFPYTWKFITKLLINHMQFFWTLKSLILKLLKLIHPKDNVIKDFTK